MYRLDVPDTERLPSNWSGIYMSLSLLFAIVGAYSAILFAERVIAFRLRRTAAVRDFALDSDKTSCMVGLFASCTCISLNSIWLMHFTASFAVTHGPRLIVFEVGLVTLSIIFIILGSFIGALIVAGGEPLLNGGKNAKAILPKSLRFSKRHRVSKSAVAAYQQRPDIGEVLNKLTNPGYMTRVIVGGFFCGLGVFLMHYCGMASTRIERAVMVFDYRVMLVTLAYAIAGGAIVLFLLFNVRGLFLRSIVSVVIGGAVLSVHSVGYLAMTAYEAPDKESEPDIYASNVFDARPYIVLVTILSSVIRYSFMGVAPL